MPLQPEKNIQKILISTTSQIVGSYEEEDILLTHAWLQASDRASKCKGSESPVSRETFVLVIQTDTADNEANGTFPDYSYFSEQICSYLSVLFGKRFDCHGLVEGNGFYYVPNLEQFGHISDPRLPYNSHEPRLDFTLPLDLKEVSKIYRLLHNDSLDSDFLSTFNGAAKFYLQALQNIEDNPEIAYLHLITAGEILSNYFKFETNDLIDDETKSILDKIRNGIPDGDKVCAFITSKLFQVKRRFVESLLPLINDEFFDKPGSSESNESIKRETLEKTISAAYDLRSWYVHKGTPFGSLVFKGTAHRHNEVLLGRTITADKKLDKIFSKVPTFIGLERIIRYALLRFAQNNGAFDYP